MSIIERLFPASELEALRASPYDFDLEPSTKRRKLSPPSSVDSASSDRRGSSDSGYSSDESNPIPESWLASRKRSRTSLSSSSSSSQNSASAQFTQSALFRKYLTSMHPHDRARYRLRTHSASSPLTPDDMKDFYQQITLARSRSRSSVSGLPTPPYSNGGSTHPSPHSLAEDHADDEAESCVPDVGQGWTAGPKSAVGADLTCRLLDGIRLTTHERSMLNSLIPDGQLPQLPQSTPKLNLAPTFTYPHRRESQIAVPTPTRSSFAGIAIGTYDDDEEDEVSRPDLDGFSLEGEGTGKVEDFFNIEEACDESPNASVDCDYETS